MSEFQELIKSFSKCRDYVRDFFVYGFKSRQDFTSNQKSARTYDDERRRITSWLYEYVAEDLTGHSGENKSKNISLQMDSNLLDTNPLFSVWKTKSFTKNDILLHFFLFDALGIEAYSANELAEILSRKYYLAADTQMVRRKCNEYVREGLLFAKKQGKSLLYQRGLTWEELGSAPLLDAISLMQMITPFGYVGNTITSRLGFSNQIFRTKHGFPAFTLEEEIAASLLDAKENHNYVEMTVQSNRTPGSARTLRGVPLKILVSTRTGRRYICIYHMKQRHIRRQEGCSKSMEPHPDWSAQESFDEKIKFTFRCLRLDQIKSVREITPPDKNCRDNRQEILWEKAVKTSRAYPEMSENLTRNLPYVWGVSFAGSRTKVALTLHVREQWEGFILTRLEREGKGGTVTRLSENTFYYEKIVFDAEEMFPWLRTFLGRIIDIHFYRVDMDLHCQTENRLLRKHFLSDIDSLCSLYEIDTSAAKQSPPHN